MATTATEKKKYSSDDYLKTSDDERYELIEGDMLMTPSPVPKHKRISGKLEFEIRKYVTENDLGEVFDAPSDAYLLHPIQGAMLVYESVFHLGCFEKMAGKWHLKPGDEEMRKLQTQPWDIVPRYHMCWRLWWPNLTECPRNRGNVTL